MPNYMGKAIAYFRSGNMVKAESLLMKVLRQSPHHIEAIHYLIQISYNNGDYDSVITYLTKAIHLAPTNADYYNNLGFFLKSKGRIDEAVECFRKAIHYHERFVNAHYNLGNALKIKGCLDDAVAYYQTVLRLDAKDYEAWNNLGNVLMDQGKLDEALTCYERSLHINPSFALALSNMGAVFQEKGLFEKAYECYQKALTADPQSISALNNMGVALREEGLLDEAMTYYEKAFFIDPDDAEAHWNRAITCLLAGRYEEGWRHYEWRFRKKDASVIERNISQPRWGGENIAGKTILLYAEQGLGDTVQFIRYAPFVADRYARVVVECQRELVTLIQNVKGVEKVYEKGVELAECDVWCPLLSLPFVLETTQERLPADVPYIRVLSEKKDMWREKVLHNPTGFRVGIAWAGNPKYKHDRVRSCSPELIARLSEIQSVVLYSLQKDAEARNARALAGGAIFDYMDEVRDFSDTAALIENLDLVISVDTAVAHVAGALGKEVWTLLRHAPDWRWLLNRKDSPWYPTMRLFRQQKFADWESVIEEVLLELRKKLSLIRM